MELLLDGYRLLVGVALLVVVYGVLKRCFREPFIDPLDQPDYMIKLHRSKK